ncbi:M48 family metallopeptidase [Desulfovermiculus halophilus]|uniref:M48 family metallopeptidase n=1 Tax=Desulfovermiculus halophilus TaxID=339722 RepID=UPI000487D3AD|nr:M48 family metallopeptidase [Desulfovermiculus halophilus]
MFRCWHILVCILLTVALIFPPNVRAAFGEFGIKDEAELGEKFKILMQAQFPLVKDPYVLDYIQGILDRVKDTLPPQPFPVRINVMLDPSINAFAAPAGYVFVNTGLIQQMENEDEIAAVIAHELAHVSERHIAQRIAQSQIISIGTLVGVLAGALLGAGGAALGQALSVGAMAGGQAASLKYSRDDEREADRLGLRFLTGAGYEPQAMMRTFQRMLEQMRMSGRNKPPDYMLTHPGLGERIGSVQDMVSYYRPKPPLAKEDTQALERVQMLIRTKYSRNPEQSSLLGRDDQELNCLELLGKGIVLAKLHRMNRAEKTFARALECRPDHPLWLREAGWFAFQNGDYARARTLLDRSLQANRGDYLARYYRARVLAETGEPDRAAADLQKVLESVPQDWQVHRALGRIVGQSGDHFRGYLHLAYSYLYAHRMEQAAKFMDQARAQAETTDQKDQVSALEKEYKERKEIL